MSFLSITRKNNFSISILNRNLLTYYKHIIMQIPNSPDYCTTQNVDIKIMSDDSMKDCIDSEYSIDYIKKLKAQYPQEFFGIVAYLDGKVAGYLCGLKPTSNTYHYRIRDCQFFVQFVYVYEEFRGKRIVSKLFSELFRLNSDVQNVKLAVRINNLSARKAYKRIGGTELCTRYFLRIGKVNVPYYRV